MNIDNYGFERSDLVVATAVNAYLKKLTPEARREMLAGLTRQGGEETVINGEKLAVLIESAMANAMTGSEAWKPGEGIYQQSLSFIREMIPSVDGKEYVKTPPEEFLQFIVDWTKE